MEVKEIQEIKTAENLTQAVRYYRQISEEISRLELSKKVAREAILEKFRETEMRVYDTPSGPLEPPVLRARVDTRKGADYIVVKEAKALLDEDTYSKLVHEGTTVVVLSVRLIKAEEKQDA